MSSFYPTALDDASTLPDPGASDTTDSPSHAGLHSNSNDAIKKIESKIGTGSSTPTNNTLLLGNGTGTSAWGQLSSSALKSIVTDETGSGSLVFGTSPTLVTPQVDTISESTATNGVTIDGLNMKDGKLNTNNSVVTSNITPGAITTGTLAQSAVTLAKTESGFMKRLGFSTKTTNTTLLTTSYATQITVTATSVGGECEAQFMITVRNAGAGSGVANGFLKVRCDGVDVTPIDLKAETVDAGTPNSAYSLAFIVKSTPAAGSHTWTLQAKANLNSSVYVDEGVLKITEIAS